MHTQNTLHLFLSKNNFPWGGLLSFRLFIFVYCRQMNHLPKTLNFVFLICVFAFLLRCVSSGLVVWTWIGRQSFFHYGSRAICARQAIWRYCTDCAGAHTFYILWRLCSYFVYTVQTVQILCILRICSLVGEVPDSWQEHCILAILQYAISKLYVLQHCNDKHIAVVYSCCTSKTPNPRHQHRLA